MGEDVIFGGLQSLVFSISEKYSFIDIYRDLD